jgi:hypothetical protein
VERRRQRQMCIRDRFGCLIRKSDSNFKSDFKKKVFR